MKLFSEKMSPLGVVNIDSITNLFAVTELDDVSVFVRETAQNSWDARDKSTANRLVMESILTTPSGDIFSEKSFI
jgi:hypothetical protein